ncbi:sigma-54-dependent transcriptional regulator [candidate division KSB1 bacterium]
MDIHHRLLVIDDELNTLEGLKEILSQEGYQVMTSLSGEEGIETLKKNDFDLIITDLMLPGMSGMEFSSHVLKEYPDIKIIIITAFGTVRSAVEAMKEGVFNYITKPIDIDEMLIVIGKALKEQSLEMENIALKSKTEAKYTFDNIIGQSGPMIEIFEKVLKVAKSSSTVMLRGESGTGKELIAHSIHQHSNRVDKPFVEINCSAFPDTLLDSELFGYERGAFTGAYKTKIGRFESAEEGTIFLDEIGDINPSVQVKLLRILQEKTFSRLGSTKNININVRVIAATNSNLEASIKEGKFREDLYYRLNVIPIIIPPLRKRKSDIALLFDHFILKYSRENNKKAPGISPKVRQLLLNYHWPGNVRELENAIENAVVMCDTNVVTEEHLPSYLTTLQSPVTSVDLPGEEMDYQTQLELSERQIIQKALEKVDYNKTKAAELLGISLRTMRYKVKKYSL